MKELKIKLDEGAIKPTRNYPTDAGLDLYAKETKVIFPRQYSSFDSNGFSKALPIGETFDTGVHIELEPGTFAQVVSRSGLNIKHDIVCCGGTLDSSYRGSIRVKIYNLGTEPYTVKAGDRIAQMVILPCLLPEVVVVDDLSDTDRGEKGIGSSGR